MSYVAPPPPEDYVDPQQMAAPPPDQGDGGYIAPPPPDDYEAAPADAGAYQPAPAPTDVQQLPPPTVLDQAASAVQQAADYIPQPVGGALSGWVPPIGEVATNLVQGDIGGAFQAGLEYANRPLEYANEQQGGRAATAAATGEAYQPVGLGDVNPAELPAQSSYNPKSLRGTGPGPLRGIADAIGPVLTAQLPGTGGLPPNPVDVLPHLGSTIVGMDLNEWAAAHPDLAQAALDKGGEQALVEAWKAWGGASSAPPPQLSNPVDTITAGDNILGHLGGLVKGPLDMAGGYKDAAQQGTLGPFLKGMAIDLSADPTVLGQLALPAVGGAAAAGERAAAAAGHPVIAAGLGAVAKLGEGAVKATDVALDPVTSGIAPAAKGIKNLGGLLDQSRASRISEQGDQLVEAGMEGLGAMRAAQAEGQGAPVQAGGEMGGVPPGQGLPNYSVMQDDAGFHVVQNQDGRILDPPFASAAEAQWQAMTLEGARRSAVPTQVPNPAPAVPSPQPQTRTPATRFGPSAQSARRVTGTSIPMGYDPFASLRAAWRSRDTPRQVEAAWGNQREAMRTSPTTGRPMGTVEGAPAQPTARATPQPAGSLSPHAIGMSNRRWVTPAGAPLVEGAGDAARIATPMRGAANQVYDAMFTASPEDFWASFGQGMRSHSFPAGDLGLFARWRGAMTQGLFMLDDWSEARAGRYNAPRAADGGLNWDAISQQAERSQNPAFRKMLAGKRAHDLYVYRIANSADPGREIFNLLATYHLDQYGDRFQHLPAAYWAQRAEMISEIMRDSQANFTPELAQQLANTDIAQLAHHAGVRDELALRARSGLTLWHQGQPVLWTPDATPVPIAHGDMRAASWGQPDAPDLLAPGSWFRTQVEQQTRAQLDQYGLTDVGLAFMRDLADLSPSVRRGDKTAGVYRAQLKLVGVALDATKAFEGITPMQHFLGVIDHEAIHALKAMALFTQREWDTLVHAAKTLNATYAETGRTLKDIVQANYATDTFASKAPAHMDEELVAYLFQFHAMGGRISDYQARHAIGKIVDFIVGIGRALRGTGAPEEVLRKIQSGEIGRRRRDGWSGAEFYEQKSKITFPTYHATNATDLGVYGKPGVLKADLPEGARNFPYASAEMGVFMTADPEAAFDWLPARYGGPGNRYLFEAAKSKVDAGLLSHAEATRQAGIGAIYQAHPALENTYDMSSAEYSRFYDSADDVRREGAAFKQQLEAAGHDGIVVWDGKPRVEPDGTILPQNRKFIKEIVSFQDVPVADRYVHRLEFEAPQQMRDAIEASTANPAGVKDRDPNFIYRFRGLLEGKTPEEVMAILDQPLADPRKPGFLDRVDPDQWEHDSAARMDAAIAWAEGFYGKEKVAAALKEAYTGKKGNPNALKPPSALDYHNMFKQAAGHAWWYDLSGMGFDTLKNFTTKQLSRIIDMVAATSGGERPHNNLKLTFAVGSVLERGENMSIGLRDEVAMEYVLQGLGHPGPKFNNFSRNLKSQTLALKGLGEDSALPTVDMWHFRAYNVDPNIGARNEVLYAIIAKHTIDETDALQKVMGDAMVKIGGKPTVLEHRMVQAGIWVLGRENKGFGKLDAKLVGMKQGSDYWSAMQAITGELDKALPASGLAARGISREDFLSPQFTNALTNYNYQHFTEGPHFLVEAANTNTVAGVDLADFMHNLVRLDPTHKVATSALNTVAKIQRGVLQKLVAGDDSPLNALARAITGNKKFAFSRTDYYSWGSWVDSVTGETRLNPQLDIPLYGRINTTRGDVRYLDDAAATQLMAGISQALRQDGTAANRWKIHEVEPGTHNAWIIQSPDEHLEYMKNKSRVIDPVTIERNRQIGAQLGWPTQVIASPSHMNIRLINDGQEPLSREQLLAAIDAAGYDNKTFRVVAARHDSIYFEPEGETGYAGRISNVRSGDTPGQPGAIPGAGRSIGLDGRGQSPDDFVAALERIRAISDEGDAKLGAALPKLRASAEKALAERGLTWETHPAYAARREALAALGGADPRFPVSRDIFHFGIGDEPSAADRHALASIFSGLPVERQMDMLDDTPHDAVMGPWAVITSRSTLPYLTEQLDFHFRDGEQLTQRTGDALYQLDRDMQTWIDLAGMRNRTAEHEAEFARLSTRFSDPAMPIDAAKLGQSANQQTRDLLISSTLADAWQRALPPAKKATGIVAVVDKVNTDFLHFRRRAQLYNYANIPRFIAQQQSGNTVTALIKAPGVVPDMLFRPGQWRAVVGKLSGKGTHTFWDDIEARMGLGVDRNISMADKDALGKFIAGGTPSGGRLGKLIAPDWARVWGNASDINARESTAWHTVEGGYQRLNRAMPERIRQMRDTFDARSNGGLKGITDEDINRAFSNFLDKHRTVTNGNTGKPYTTMTGRVARYEPVWGARDLKASLRHDLSHAPGFRTVDPTAFNDFIDRIGRDSLQATRQIKTNAAAKVDELFFSWRQTNLDEKLAKVFMFHYWTSRAGALYLKTGITHPWMAAAYYRMMEGFQDEADQLDMPNWLKGFFQFMGTPAGFSIWHSPTDLASTLLTFADWQYGDAPSPFDDLTPVGKVRAQSPLLINPLLDLIGYGIGGYGPDAQVPDVLGLNRVTSTAGDLLNLANAHGMLPAWVHQAGIGVDAEGNPSPIVVRPLTELYAKFGNALSTRLRQYTGLPSVPVPDVGASQSRNIAYIIEQDIRHDFPGIDQGIVDRKVTDILADHGSPEYQRAYQQAAQMPYMTGKLDTPLPDWAEAILGGIGRAFSPIQVVNRPEQAWLDSMDGLRPSGAIPPRNLGTDESAGNDAKYGASKTVEGRRLQNAYEDYWESNDPRVEDAYYGRKTIRDASGSATVGGITYSADQLAALPYWDRNALAEQYLGEVGVTKEQIDNMWAERDQMKVDDPQLAGYMEFKRLAEAYDGGPDQFVADLRAGNPAYDQWWRSNVSPEDHINHYPLTTDGYLASQAIRPTYYDPVSGQEVGQGVPGVTPGDTIQNQAAANNAGYAAKYDKSLQVVYGTADLPLRTQPSGGSAARAQIGTGVEMKLIARQGDWAYVAVPDPATGIETAGYVPIAMLYAA